MTDPDAPTVIDLRTARRWVLAAVGLVVVIWASVAVCDTGWRLYAEWDMAEHLAAATRAGDPLTDAEFDWAVARISNPYTAIARPARTAARGPWPPPRGPERTARLAAAAEVLLDGPDPYGRLFGVEALFLAADFQPPAGPLRTKMLAVAIALLDDPQPFTRAGAVMYVGLLGTADHLPRVRAVRDAATEPSEKQEAEYAVKRLGGKP